MRESEPVGTGAPSVPGQEPETEAESVVVTLILLGVEDRVGEHDTTLAPTRLHSHRSGIYGVQGLFFGLRVLLGLGPCDRPSGTLRLVSRAFSPSSRWSPPVPRGYSHVVPTRSLGGRLKVFLVTTSVSFLGSFNFEGWDGDDVPSTPTVYSSRPVGSRLSSQVSLAPTATTGTPDS